MSSTGLKAAFRCHCGDLIVRDTDGVLSYGADGPPIISHQNHQKIAPPVTRVAILNVRVSFVHVLRNFLNSRGNTPAALADALTFINTVADATS